MDVLISKNIPIKGEMFEAWSLAGEKTAVFIKNDTVHTRLRDYGLVCYEAIDYNGKTFFIVVTKARMLITRDEVIRGREVNGILLDTISSTTEAHSCEIGRVKILSSNAGANIIACNSLPRMMVLEKH